jgi:hypothetical protein
MPQFYFLKKNEKGEAWIKPPKPFYFKIVQAHILLFVPGEVQKKA